MKKLILLTATFFLTLSAQAQSELFGQNIDGGFGVASGYSDVSSIGFYSADDFELTAAQTDIHYIRLFGFQNDDNLLDYLSSFSLYIYTDDNGSPSGDPTISGSGVLEIVDLPISSSALNISNPFFGVYNITLNLSSAPLSLGSGIYWIVAVPHYNIDATTLDLNGDNRLWYWTLSDNENNFDSQFMDPLNLLGGGWNAWTPTSSIFNFPPSAVDALAFALWDGNDDIIAFQNPSAWNAFLSGYSDFSSFGFFSSDDFNLTEESEIGSVTVYGSQYDNNLENLITGFSLYIYADNGGLPAGDPSVPGGGVLEILNLPPTSPALTISHPDNGIYYFTVDIALAQGTPLTLPAGVYWIVPVAHYNIDATTINIEGDPRTWGWFLSEDNNLTEAQFVDPVNFLEEGWTSWTPISDYSITTVSNNKAFAFTIIGDNLSIEQNVPLNEVSLYPNPVKNQLHINMLNGLSIESALVFDLLGKRHIMKIGQNNILDMSQMPSGIYLLKLETSEGSLTKKFIKE